MFQSKT